ncbi:uncharacterized protein CcaverHIS019_0311190 [Cutaneotrichosporon cavernicola]|uniref:Protein kinase domain-containing protein n=1 Tax=Cutaneotrichosporon cavernicola TaxID=279322 RepID=A0AA48QV46_9TREE|nr:uncharacterized protein CcaverHIS019_0311190 [Cutaneotrichosporon cavernicola]BEI91049.1 hypothetical protein CcaverHIS019_0311190 [Cutaneotrichosporon cavernicola]
MATAHTARQNHSYSSSVANTRQAQLTNAYSSLAQELASDSLKVVGGYTLGKVIGEGTFGSVHIACHRLTGMRCAIKKVAKASTPQLTREIHHHRRLHHPHIVHLHEIIATENHIWLVSELCPGGELFDYLVERGRILEGEARRIFGELCTAVGWLHRQGIVHRDLKLENVLLDGELGVKLGDLGFAREYQKGRLMETFCGTTGYASPEMLAGKKYLGVATDIWSLGIILYTLLCGGLPFDDDDERVMRDLIIKGEYEEPEWITEDARSLIRGMLQSNPDKRLSMESILTHPWFKKTIYDNIQNASSTISLPPSGPTSPVTHPMASTESIINRKRPSTSSISSFPFTPRASSGPQLPVTQEPSEMAASPEGESEPSETSFEKSTSGDTSPTTAENEEETDMKRIHSGKTSLTESALELAHKNSSETTLRKPDSLRERLARMSLEGPREEDELEATSRADKRLSASSLPMIDEHSLALPVADHSRTPVRTKRRSLTSQLPLERRLSHHSISSQWQAFVSNDYFSLLKADLPPLFSTPSEKLLVQRLSDLGFDIGQLMHSVKTDACDSSSAMWWILRLKQLERGETDDAVLAKREKELKRKEKSRKKNEEKDRVEEEAAGIPTPEPLSSDQLALRISSFAADRSTMKTPELLLPPSIANPPRPLSSHSIQSANSALSGLTNQLERSISPPTSNTTVVAPSPTQTEQSPSKEPRTKARSQSINMLQRATSMLLPGIRRTDVDHKPGVQDSYSPHSHSPHGAAEKSGHPDHNGQQSQLRVVTPEPSTEAVKRGDSPSKTGNNSKLGVPLMSKLTMSESDPTLLILATANNQGQGHLNTPPNASPTRSLNYGTPTAGTPEAGTSKQTTSTNGAPAAKKDSIWSTFRHLFNEDRRRRKREAVAANKAPPVIPTRSARPAVSRAGPPSASRRASYDGTRPMFSHRSSSVNSRRSSIASNSVPPEFIINLHDGLSHNLGRRTSGRSVRSTGTETPNSERDGPSRAGSVHSRRGGGSRRSSIRTPTFNGDGSNRFRPGPPASPLNDYHRRSASGSASTRVRHIKVLHEAKSIRPNSVASSVRSNASSRASSILGRDDESDDDGTGQRRTSLSDDVSRVRSPLSRGMAIGRGKPPLRDVFSKRNDDDDWISEDDEFAGGLGQGAWSYGATAKWSSASVRPSSVDGATGGTSAASRFTTTASGKKTVGDAIAPVCMASATPSSSQSSGSGASRRDVGRRGLPATRGAPAQIIEEEEEEDEE